MRKDETMAQKGQRVRFLYRGSFPDTEVFDDCNGKPHEITLGLHQVMRTLEDALLDMEVGEERTLRIAAADAYGTYDGKAVQRVPTYRIPQGDRLAEGETIAWTSPRNAEPLYARVLGIENQIASLDFNHPLAGKDIVYWIKLIEVLTVV